MCQPRHVISPRACYVHHPLLLGEAKMPPVMPIMGERPPRGRKTPRPLGQTSLKSLSLQNSVSLHIEYLAFPVRQELARLLCEGERGPSTTAAKGLPGGTPRPFPEPGSLRLILRDSSWLARGPEAPSPPSWPSCPPRLPLEPSAVSLQTPSSSLWLLQAAPHVLFPCSVPGPPRPRRPRRQTGREGSQGNVLLCPAMTTEFPEEPLV